MIRRNNLTRAQWAALYKARRDGASIADLQDWFGVSSGVAREVARGYDGRPPREAAKVIYPRIAAWMVENRITWKVFTLETGLRYNTLRDILYGRTRSPKPETLGIIARAVGMTVEEAFYKEDLS